MGRTGQRLDGGSQIKARSRTKPAMYKAESGQEETMDRGGSLCIKSEGGSIKALKLGAGCEDVVGSWR